MRIAAGVLVLGLATACSTPASSELGHGPDTVTVTPKAGVRADLPQQDVSYGYTVYTNDQDRPADAVLEPGEALAKKGEALRLVRAIEAGKVKAVSGSEPAWEATTLAVRIPRPGEISAGQTVFYSSASPKDLRALRASEWHEGKVDRVDPIFGRIVIGGATVDPGAVLVPAP